MVCRRLIVALLVWIGFGCLNETLDETLILGDDSKAKEVAEANVIASDGLGKKPASTPVRCRAVNAPAYVVHAGNCSRSIQLLGKFASMEDVYRALFDNAGGSTRKLTCVTTGNENVGPVFCRGGRSDLNPKGCSVYVRAEGGSPKLHARTKTADEAGKLARQLGATEKQILVVYHF